MKKLMVSVILIAFAFSMCVPCFAQSKPAKSLKLDPDTISKAAKIVNNSDAIARATKIVNENKEFFNDPEKLKLFIRVAKSLNKKKK